MGKKPQRHGWPEAKKLCRLNQDDIEMAKRLGFGPDSLLRARPDPKQRWKLPVREWIHELHFKRFGHVIGDKPVVSSIAKVEYNVEAARPAAGQAVQSQQQPQPMPAQAVDFTDEDVPF